MYIYRGKQGTKPLVLTNVAHPPSSHVMQLATASPDSHEFPRSASRASQMANSAPPNVSRTPPKLSAQRRPGTAYAFAAA
ncbi:hypothetical protein M431DRAFT_491329 [Trichoderma harzianum CBS 226.95]|uniref:Uncharacterized protein n=1 Tax=Trichoderma harzianum CBS 226.95 TaxID=983964 RepID=A0A2T4ARL6_TRIHA|nr:hypothetical protein M431DRAFT_491329 [Trichoderma harzianum CBS 226.95]PTB59711.1 hypothetical protein M431DRAFT_491329 [Trichoderma harzianum CBS 226.95]